MDASDEALVRDWLRLWREEAAAWANDTETREAWRTLGVLWSDSLASLARGWSGGAEPDADRGAARPATAGVAPDAGGDAIRRLEDRVDALERQLAGLAARDGIGSKRPKPATAGEPKRRSKRPPP